MDIYIERGMAINEFTIQSQFYDAEWGNKRFTPDDVKMIICSIPAANVRPVMRGKWITYPYMMGNTQYCSLCGENYGVKYNFCPNCGADMREQPKEE